MFSYLGYPLWEAIIARRLKSGEAALDADESTIARLLRDVLPGATLAAVEQTSGGLANTNFKVSLTAETAIERSC
jgi:hypothetical protein